MKIKRKLGSLLAIFMCISMPISASATEKIDPSDNLETIVSQDNSTKIMAQGNSSATFSYGGGIRRFTHKR